MVYDVKNGNIGRRGELTSQQLVMIIVLIVSFAVIMIFFYIFNFKGEVSKESCRNSVLMRGTALSKSIVSLQCETKDVCFSMTKNCKGAKKGSEIVQVVDKRALLDGISNLMYDCWWQMGEGKVDYRVSGIGTMESYCAVCNTIKIDDSVRNNIGSEISLAEIYNYLEEKKVTGKNINYLEYLFKVNSVELVRENLRAISGRYGKTIDIDNQKISLNQDLALVTALTKEGWAVPAISGGAGGAVAYFAAVAVFGSNPIGWVALGAGAATGAIAGTIGYYSVDMDVKYLQPTIIGYNGEEFQALNCKEFSTLA